MMSVMLLAKATFQKNKSQMIGFMLLIIISSALMNLGLTTFLNYPQLFDQYANDMQSADVITTIQNKDETYIKTYQQELLHDPDTKQMEQRNVLFFAGKCQYRNSETLRQFAVLNKNDKQEIGKISMMEESNKFVEHGIYLPYLFHTGGQYNLLDDFTLTIIQDGKEVTFTYQIKGFYEEMMLATINSSTTGLLLDDEEYQTVSKRLSHTIDATMFLMKVNQHDQNSEYATRHLPTITSTNPSIRSDMNYYETIKQSRTLTSSIGATLIIAFSMIMMVILVIVIRFKIQNTIVEDMKNIGAYKAIGYTGIQILLSLMLPYLIIGGIGGILGIGLSNLLLPFLSYMFAIQTGLTWHQGLDALCVSMTLLFLMLIISLITMVTSMKAKKLTPIVALRSGFYTHNFKRNHVPLDKHKATLTVLLAMKALIQNLKANVMVSIVISAIAFASVFAGVLFYNISYQFDNFLFASSGDIADIIVESKTHEDHLRLKKDLEKISGVDHSVDFYTDNAFQCGHEVVICYTSENFLHLRSQQVLYQGRFPKYANEVAIGGLLASKLHKEPGEMITLKKGDKEQEYLITGLIQGANYMGHDVAITEEGYRLFVKDYEARTLNIYTKDKQEIEDTIQYIKQHYSSNIIGIQNNRKVVEASMGSYRDIVSALVCVIAGITLFIIILIMYLVQKTSILQRKQEFGILKAIGYTSKQLIHQIALTSLMVFVIGAMTGAILGYYLINPLLSMLLSYIGMMKVQFEIPWMMLITIILLICLTGSALAMWIARRIKKISPYLLVNEN